MKKTLFAVLLSVFSILGNTQGITKVKDLPNVGSSTTNDYIIKDYYSGVPGSTCKMRVSAFLSTYGIVTTQIANATYAPIATTTAGTYTPSVISQTNIDNVTPYQAQYMRVGNVVTVSGIIEIDATTALTNTSFKISVPISSSFSGGTTNAAGTCVTGFSASTPICYGISGYTPSTCVQFNAYVVDTNNLIYSYTFTYLIN